VVTKFGVGYDEMPNRRDSSRQRVMASIEKSLQRLQTDYVDIYLVHWPDVNTPFDETMRALDDIVRQGKARYIGVSNFHLGQLQACMQLRRVDVVQYGWNMFDQRMASEIFPYCAAQQIGVMAYGSLAYGMLTGTFSADMRFEESDWRSRQGNLGSLNLFRTLFGPDEFPRNLKAVDELKTLAAEYHKTLPQFALRWTTSARRLPSPGGSRRKFGRARLDHLRRGPDRDRRNIRPPRRSNGAARLARGLAQASVLDHVATGK
jgi:aryl-alcohol dehydrogenase-like predicted oxidoreductase